MSTALPIKISNSVLVWARTSIGYSIDDIAHKMNVKPEKIIAWENGTASPTYTQLENLAYKVFKRPLAVFFRTEPPKEAPIEKDFRNLTSSEISHLSTDMRLVLRKAKRLQNLIRELNKDSETELPYKKFNVSINDNPVTSANRFREFLGLSIEEQKKWKPHNSFDHFKGYIEKIGIYIFQFKMPFEEARAFSLTDDYPIIVLNTDDAKNGRIFSLFHEVCHILFNVGGVFKDKDSKNLKGEYAAIEDFCNRFAASFLVPEDLFKKDIDFNNQRLREWSDEDLEKFSRLYCVSKEVVLRKLVDLKLASKSFYFSRKKGWDAELKNFKEARNKKLKEEGRGGTEPQDSKVVKEKGKPYISKVLEGYEKGNLTYGDISEYLEVKLDHLPKIIERINK
jgi:Zn-dependent peptidase ImmA (M78 family)/DNA-binding XRE family transcriptional regulator